MTTYAAWQATVTDNSGNIADGAEVTVRSESTGLVADIFETRTGTVKANPFTTGADGFAQFYAEPGLYRIEAEYSGQFIKWRNVRLVEVATVAEAIAGTAGVLPDAAGVHAAFKQFGLGVSGSLPLFAGDLNDLKTIGFYRLSTSATTNLPAVSGTYSVIVDFANSNVRWMQTAKLQDSEAIRIFNRKFTGVTWTPWVEIQHTGNGATTAEAQAGVNDTKWMSSIKTKQAIAANNAASATKLQTARTINGVAFDGSANITIPVSSADVGTAVAGISYGQVGSMIMAQRVSGGSAASGSIVGGVTISPATAYGSENRSIVMTGSWRCMGVALESSTGRSERATTNFLRIS